MAIQPVYKPFSTRPATRARKSALIQTHALVRDQFTITTWLLLGAFIQGILTLVLPYRNILLVTPIFLILVAKLTTSLLQVCGFISNPIKHDVIPSRTTLTFPSEPNSMTPTQAGNSTVCAILLGLVSHSPLGMLADSFKQTGDRFDAMCEQLSADATKYGFLGGSAWVSSERTTSNEVAIIMYFENEEYMHAYAHGPMHTDTMAWWHDMSTKGKTQNVGIMHEVFSCPRKSWEGVYLNYHPTGISATTKGVVGPDGKKHWVSPSVQAKGNLLYSKGRMGRPFGKKEWMAYDDTLDAAEKADITY